VLVLDRVALRVVLRPVLEAVDEPRHLHDRVPALALRHAARV